jgi:hypothetical protein
MKEKSVSTQDRRRKKALLVFQLLIYTYLIGLFSFQMYLYSISDW